MVAGVGIAAIMWWSAGAMVDARAREYQKAAGRRDEYAFQSLKMKPKAFIEDHNGYRADEHAAGQNLEDASSNREKMRTISMTIAGASIFAGAGCYLYGTSQKS